MSTTRGPMMCEQENEIRVMLVDDQPLMREGIATILNAQLGIGVVAHASDGAEAIQAMGSISVDVICMDVQMPVLDGLEATRRLRRRGADAGTDSGRDGSRDSDCDSGRDAAAEGPAVVMLTTFDREDYLFEALEAGASGFLLKNSSPESLVDAVRTIAAGDALLSPEVTRRVIARFADGAPRQRGAAPPSVSPLLEHLTGREREVLTLVAQGRSNAEIAAQLFVGEATVKSHVSNVLQKLLLRDRIQAVVFAYENGVVVPGSEDGAAPGSAPPAS